MLARMMGAALAGIDAILVRVEAHGSSGLPAVNTVGLPDSSVRESRERVRSAILNSGFVYPQKRITVNLAPADLRKAGSSLDLPVAAAIVALSEGALLNPLHDTTMLLGELSLDGEVRPVPGALSAAMEARARGMQRLVVAAGNAPEAALVPGLAVVPVSSLSEAIGVLNGVAPADDVPAPGPGELERLLAEGETGGPDMAEVKGQRMARRALEVAAAGGHNLLMIGPPGAGKTMLARRLPGILPALTLEEAIEVTRIHSVARRGGTSGLVARRPFRAPHHTASDAAMVGGGGGARGMRPGEVSLAHHGVLFLDEMPEFRRNALEALRQPMEDGHVVISRSGQAARFPAVFCLVAAMNPCPCGYLGDPARMCRCTPQAVARYRGRLSGPLLDRIDLQVTVPALTYEDLTQEAGGEASTVVRDRVATARERQRARGVAPCNARLPASSLQGACALDDTGRRLMERAMGRLGLSARAHDRILRVARTIADLEGEPGIEPRHLGEAIQYRGLDREAPRST